MTALSQEWTEKLAAWRSSGLSIAAWCRRNDEGYHRFLYWRKRLQPQTAQGTDGFVELVPASVRSALCLDCNGVYLHVAPGFDADLLSEILTVLRTR